MQGLFAWGKREWPTILIIAFGAAIQIVLITRPLDFLLTNVLPDDAFYAFQIVRHIAQGLGSTFDGINLTNGYHPLWIWVLVPIFKWFSVGGTMDLAPIRAALALSVGLNIVTAFFVARILARFSHSAWVRSFGILMWVLNPFLLYETLNGLETSLALCLFSIFFLCALRHEEAKWAPYWFIGIVGGLMVLARLDMALYLLAYVAWLAVREGRKSWRAIALVLVCAGIVVSPWLVWNEVTFHSLLTSSASGEQMVNHQLIVQDHGPSIVQTLKAAVYSTQNALADTFQRTGMLSMAVAFLGALVALVLLGAVPRPRLRQFPVALALFGGFLLLFIGNASVRWTVRSWYFMSFGIFTAILAVIVLDRLCSRISHKRTVAGLLLVLTAFSFAVDWSKYIQNAATQQREMYAAALWLNTHLPAGTPVGVFNAGIQGYFSNARVINLDGLVNNAAYQAMREHALWAYVAASHIAYISDFDLYLTYRYKSFFGADPYQHLTLVKKVSGTDIGAHGQGGISIYRVH